MTKAAAAAGGSKSLMQNWLKKSLKEPEAVSEVKTERDSDIKQEDGEPSGKKLRLHNEEK